MMLKFRSYVGYGNFFRFQVKSTLLLMIIIDY